MYSDTDNRREFAESLREQYSDVVKVVWKYERWHHQVNYKPFKGNTLIKKLGQDIPSGVDNYGMRLVEIKK